MNIKRIFSLALVLAIVFCTTAIPSNAAHEADCDCCEIIIENQNISEGTKEKIIAFYSQENIPDEYETEAQTYGLTCTLLGHKLEASTVRKVTHKARTTAPRCLQKTYTYQSCTRCDYETSTLKSSTYINCCA